MTRLAWLTDIHLDHAPPDRFDALCAEVEAAGADRVLIGGDIAEAPTVAVYLGRLADRLARPIDFVLGNHDYYRGSLKAVRDDLRDYCRRRPSLTYLSQSGVVPLGHSTALVGHDGWGDARLGDFDGTDLMLNDELLIEDLRDAAFDRPALRARLEALGDEAAAHLRRLLPEALAGFPRVVVLTHVPPFRAAAWHRGRPSDDEWLPRFSCQAVGNTLLEAATAHPDRHLLVLCGHTHGAGEVEVRPNLHVLTGAATYGEPHMQRVLALD